MPTEWGPSGEIIAPCDVDEEGAPVVLGTGCAPPTNWVPTSTIRGWWSSYLCDKGKSGWSDVKIWWYTENVPDPSVEMWQALNQALDSVGYVVKPRSGNGIGGPYVCRKIANTNNWSMHAYGIAVDLNYSDNLYIKGQSCNMSRGDVRQKHLDAVHAVRSTDGKCVWEWGGYFGDNMHWQIAVPPSAKVDWSTVPGGGGTTQPGQPVPDPPTGSALGAFVKEGGVWKKSSGMYVKEGGAWRPAKAVFVKVNGEWKQAK